MAQNYRITANFPDGFDADETLKSALGHEFSSAFFKLKMSEWNSYVSHFSSWEKKNALDL